MKSTRKDKTELYFWFIIFSILPFISLPVLLDFDSEPKIIVISLITIILYFKFRKASHTKVLPFAKILFYIIVIFIAFTFYRVTDAINFSEGINDWVKMIYPFAFLFLLIRSGFHDLKKAYRFIPYSVFVICAITIIQIFYSTYEKGDPVIANDIGATFSNKNFLSEVLVLLLPFTIAATLFEKGKIKKLNSWANLLIFVFIVPLQSVSAWLSIIITAIIFGLFYLYFSRKRMLKILKGKSGLLSIVMLLFIPTVFFIRFTQYRFLNPIKTKFHHAVEYFNTDFETLMKNENEKNVNSVFERMFLWRSSYKLGNEKPLTGIGVSNWKIEWPKYGVAGASFLSSGIMHYEHPHNEYLLFFSETGIIGAILFLLIFIIPIIIALKSFSSKNPEYTDISIHIPDKLKLNLLMSAGIFSFLIMSLFAYPFHRPYAIILVMVQIAIIINNSNSGNKVVMNNSFALTGLFISIFSFIVGMSRASGEYHMNDAFHAQSKSQFRKMQMNVDKAENNFFHFDLTNTPLDWYRGFARFYSGQDSALYYFMLAEKQNPYHIQILSDIGASLENSGKHEEAITYFERALQIVPHYNEVHFNLAIAYYNLNKPNKALEEIIEADMVGETHNNALLQILRLNAESLIDSMKTPEGKICMKNYAVDYSKMREVYLKSREVKEPFNKLLKDSCRIQ